MTPRTRLLATACAFILMGPAAFAQPPAAAQTPRMAITIDDLPISQPSWHTPQQMRAITQGLMAALAAHGANAVGFVNAQKLDVDGEVDDARIDLLRTWLASGQELGNHTRSHPSLHEIPVDDWLADVVAGEAVVKDLVVAGGGTWRWFRHPYLHVGTTPTVQAQTHAFLAERGYTVAPVSLDNSDWLYARAYAKAWNDGDEAGKRRLGEDYLRYMLEVVAYYEEQTTLVVGRPIPQILLIHANALNADWLGALLDNGPHVRRGGVVIVQTAPSGGAAARIFHGHGFDLVRRLPGAHRDVLVARRSGWQFKEAA